MILPKSFRKLVAVFRGEVSPTLILLSVLLGFWFGLTPGWYGIHVALLVLVLILSVNIGIFVMFAALGKALCYAAAPALFYVGQWTQVHLAPVLDALASVPVVGITDFSRYSVAGAVVAGPLLGLVCGLWLAGTVAMFRRAWLKLEDKSEAFRKWHAKGWVRLLDRLLLGKRVKDVRAVLRRRTRFVRLAGVAVAVVVVAASALGLHFIEQDRLTGLAAEALTRVNGAEVNLGRLDLAVLAGRVSVTDVQVTDPESPERNRLAVGKLVADAGLWDLLRGKLVMDDVALAAVAFDQPRARPGTVLTPIRKLVAPSFDPARFDLSRVDAARLEAYFQNAQEVRAWLKKISAWLPEGEREPPPAPAAPHRYLEYVTARAAVPPTPLVVVKRVTLEDVAIPVEQIGRSTITCTNLSDAPAAAGLPVSIALKSRERPTEITVVSHYERPAAGAEISAQLGDIDLRKLQTALRPNNPVVFEGGTAVASLAGHANREMLDVAIQVQTKGMRARSTGGGLFGLDPQIVSEAVKVLENLQTNLRLVGPLAQPRLVFDSPSLTSEFRDALVRAGKQELVQRLDDVLKDKLPGGLPDAEKALADPLGAAGQALGGLLDGQKSKEAADEEGKQDQEATPEDKQKKRDPLSRLKERRKKKEP